MPPPAGTQTHTDLDLADVALGRRLHAVGVQQDLTAPAKRQTGGTHDDWHLGVPKRGGRALERANHQIDLVPVPFLRLEEHEHQIGADREI